VAWQAREEAEVERLVKLEEVEEAPGQPKKQEQRASVRSWLQEAPEQQQVRQVVRLPIWHHLRREEQEEVQVHFRLAELALLAAAWVQLWVC